MNKIRLIFVAAIFSIAVAVILLVFNRARISKTDGVSRVSVFQVMQISKNGNVFYSDNPINGRDFTQLNRVSMSRMVFDSEIYFRTDNSSAFEFYFGNMSLSVSPNSYLHYLPKTGELWFYEGQFTWRRLLKGKNVEIYLLRDGESGVGTPSRTLVFSDQGKARLAPGELVISNYAGEAVFIDSGASTTLPERTMLTLTGTKPPTTASLLGGPESISPLNETRSVIGTDNTVISFGWKAVSGASSFMVRFYPSNLMENVIYEKSVDNTRLNQDMLLFEDYREFYWRVTAVDGRTGLEGAPSEMGCIRITGTILNKEELLRKPELRVESQTVSGNRVLFTGYTNSNRNRVLVNGSPVLVDDEGKFQGTHDFFGFGDMKMEYKAISPVGLETRVVKPVQIYDND